MDDLEIWETVQVNPVYQVSNFGRARTIDHPDGSYDIRHALSLGLIGGTKQSLNSHLGKLTPEQVSYIKSGYGKIDVSIKGNKKKFCARMRRKFNLKSSNTIFWIIKDGANQTNKFIS